MWQPSAPWVPTICDIYSNPRAEQSETNQEDATDTTWRAHTHTHVHTDAASSHVCHRKMTTLKPSAIPRPRRVRHVPDQGLTCPGPDFLKLKPLPCIWRYGKGLSELLFSSGRGVKVARMCQPLEGNEDGTEGPLCGLLRGSHPNPLALGALAQERYRKSLLPTQRLATLSGRHEMPRPNSQVLLGPFTSSMSQDIFNWFRFVFYLAFYFFPSGPRWCRDFTTQHRQINPLSPSPASVHQDLSVTRLGMFYRLDSSAKIY